VLDVLIIGSGGAGLSAALAAKETSTLDGVGQGNASILVVGKSLPTQAQTSMAQGAINAALGNEGEDHPSIHIDDTIRSARGLCDENMVRKLCADAPKTIEWLEGLGVPFSRKESASSQVLESIAQRQMGGASAKRACYAQDYTGLKILHTLYDTCLKEKIDFLDEHYLINLVTQKTSTDTGIKGAIFLNIRSGELVQIDAKSVVIATGGYGSLYHGYTTNAYGTMGDGIAAVLRAGGSVSDMEFIQFHPTGLKHSCILMSESARGEGGYLVNSDNERFIDELKPRDEVARAIFVQRSQGKEVFLDLRHLGEEKLHHLLPQELALCKLHEGIDPATQLVPIKPVAHYTMGGIDVDDALEINGIKGCFAAGECSNAKVHGANRLGGNSLLEIIAFGKFAGENAYKQSIYASNIPATTQALEKEKEILLALYTKENQLNFYTQRKALGKLFYEKVGIVRENSQLSLALDTVMQMQVALSKMGIADKAKQNNQTLVEYLEFQNALLLAPAIISSALARDESRGAHFKQGFEVENDAFKKHIVLQWKV